MAEVADKSVVVQTSRQGTTDSAARLQDLTLGTRRTRERMSVSLDVLDRRLRASIPRVFTPPTSDTSEGPRSGLPHRLASIMGTVRRLALFVETVRQFVPIAQDLIATGRSIYGIARPRRPELRGS